MVAEVLLIKDENRYLLEHLTYNAAAGVEHFFIYDNMSRTPVADFLHENARDFLNICTVTRYHSNNNLQLDCYADFLREHRHVDWTVFCDTDECFTGNIRDAVAEFGSNYNCLSFSPILHGCNGKIYDDGGGMFERFENDVADHAHHWYKFVARTADIVSIPNPHCNVMRDKRLEYLTAANYPQCTLHHFRYRSFEEFIIKIKRGTCLCLSERDRHKMAEFFEANPTISQIAPEVVALMQRYGVDVNFEQKYNN